jgi:2-polyprenyl-3-methyl-5-hydroxy-6-metoxy-1,4-benzoquinol methylase
MSLARDPSAIYTEPWFRQHYEQEHEYRAIGRLLHETFGSFDCIDIGCGVGLIIDELDQLGHIVTGVDGSKHAKLVAPESISFRIATLDITQADTTWLFGVERKDLVLCTEVAEHLPGDFAPSLVGLLSRLCRDYGHIFFTAALPGQGGHDHINEQPNSYWIALFADRGRMIDWELTMRMRERLMVLCPLMNFFARTTMVFK